MSSFLKVSRECYDRLLFPKNASALSSKHLSDASIAHTVGGFVEEVKRMCTFCTYVLSKQVPM